MVTNYEQLKRLIEKYGNKFNLQEALEKEKAGVTKWIK